MMLIFWFFPLLQQYMESLKKYRLLKNTLPLPAVFMEIPSFFLKKCWPAIKKFTGLNIFHCVILMLPGLILQGRSENSMTRKHTLFQSFYKKCWEREISFISLGMIIPQKMAAVSVIIFMLMTWQKLICWRFLPWLMVRRVQFITWEMVRGILLRRLLRQHPGWLERR